jgi:hypothetical protein
MPNRNFEEMIISDNMTTSKGLTVPARAMIHPYFFL